MNVELLRVLREADRAQECDWRHEMARIRPLLPVAEGLTGRRFELDENVQDSTFLTDLGTYDEFRRPGVLRLAVLALRFSLYGRLFTTWSVASYEGLQATALAPALVTAVISAVKEHDYVYVPGTELHEPYSGERAEFGKSSWWARFFDYC